MEDVSTNIQIVDLSGRGTWLLFPHPSSNLSDLVRSFALQNPQLFSEQPVARDRRMQMDQWLCGRKGLWKWGKKQKFKQNRLLVFDHSQSSNRETFKNPLWWVLTAFASARINSSDHRPACATTTVETPEEVTQQITRKRDFDRCALWKRGEEQEIVDSRCQKTFITRLNGGFQKHSLPLEEITQLQFYHVTTTNFNQFLWDFYLIIQYWVVYDYRIFHTTRRT